ncbi:MAG: lipoate--protein ligase family protein [Candidatus Lokiarchaeota archaeon]|nr:lipoate--protein ligase family protein [Candidatus Harpocratesius repetitus]
MDNSKIWRLIPFSTADGYRNMAIDEVILDQVIKGKSPNTIRFYRWEPSTATIGKNQSLSAEIDMEFATSHGVQVVRRITGGGAVLHDSQNEITYSVIVRLEDIPKIIESPRNYDPKVPQRYIAILEALAQGLESVGYPIDIGKIHCPVLLTQGKKLSGNAQLIRNNVLLQHGTILLDVNPEFMYSVLKAPVGVSNAHMIQSVRSKVIGLRNLNLALQTKLQDADALKFENTENSEHSEQESKIINAFVKSFEKIFNMKLEEKPLSTDEINVISKLVAKKYSTDEWLYKFP